MIVDEDQWARAFNAAKSVVEVLYSQGKIDIPSGHPVNGSLHSVAVEIATAALRAAARDDEGDISEVSGVRIDEITNGTTSFYRQGSQVSLTATAGDGEYFSG